jgi:hypothetical protein
MYVTTGLEDIAKLFDQNAVSADAWANTPGRKKREQVASWASAQTWRQAAETLRNCRIRPVSE